tara:strand:+ start:18770 stop:19465 length:696 start_codon:yes stop_codon:yes gene_type:complete
MSDCFLPKFGVPDASPLRGPAALSPGDISINFAHEGMLYSAKHFHAQSFEVNIPLGRLVLQRLGSNFYYAKMLEFPFSVSMSFTALASEIYQTNLISEFLKNEKHNIKVSLKRTECIDENFCDRDKKEFMSYEIRGAVLDETSYQLSIGDEGRFIDVSYSAQMGSARDFKKGVFINGDYFDGFEIIDESGAESLIVREESPIEYDDALTAERDGKKDEDLGDVETPFQTCP